MLRPVLLGLGLLLLIGAGIFASRGAPYLAIWLLAAGAAITISAVFERSRYKPLLAAKPGPDWVQTNERFVDPETGKMVDVFYQPVSGERQYVSSDAGAPDQPRA